MKARNKYTGEVLDVEPTFYINAQHVAENLYVCGDKLYHENDLDFLGFGNHIDWEKRRYELAKDFTAVMLGRLNYDPFTANVCCCCSDDKPVNPYSHIAVIAVSVADTLIAELKENKRGGTE